MWIRALALALILIALGFATASACVHSLYSVYNIIDAQRALLFLKSRYIEGAGLLRAAVKAYPDNVTICVAKDDVLATRALMVLGDGELSSKILTKLNNKCSGGFNNKIRIEILFGVDIPNGSTQ